MDTPRPDPRRTTPPTTSGPDPERASPLGRGARPGTVETPAVDAHGPAEPRSVAPPGAKGGASGTLTRANEDVEPTARD